MNIVWAERRVSAWIQDRLGPNRVGPEGLLQGVADGAKNMLKEELIPAQANKVLFVLAPTPQLRSRIHRLVARPAP